MAGCAGAPLDLTGRDVFAGLDLSETQDLTALVLVGADIATGLWHVALTFWLPSEGLADKAAHDRIPYDLWARQGYLQTTPGASISYEFVAHYLKNVFDRHRVQKIAYDRWGMQHLTPWLLNAGFSEQLIKDKFVPFWVRIPVDVAGAARPRKHHLGKEIAARRSSGSKILRVQRCHRARCRRQSQAQQTPLDRPHRRHDRAHNGARRCAFADVGELMWRR
jgi:hypothetical protein